MKLPVALPRVVAMKTPAKVGIAAAIVAVVLVAAGAFWFLRDDAPDKADISATASSIKENTTTTAGGTDTTAAGSGEAGDVTGTWTVDAETGEFDYESATGTFAGIRIEEELARVGSTTAVGRTGDVSGTVEIDGTTVTAADIEVDMSTITTNDGRRDNKLQEAINSQQFPTATFTLTSPIELPADALTGAEVSVSAKGDLTVAGTTKAIEIPIKAQLVEDTIIMTGDTEITFSDFGVEVPSSPMVLSVDDVGTLELQLLLKRS